MIECRYMKPSAKTRLGLDKKFQKVIKTPASFDFFLAIHDFIKYIELNPSLAESLSPRIKANRELDIANKYIYLKKIYHGLEDVNIKSDSDLGHARYFAIRELNLIQNNNVSDNTYFWKKRELFRKLAEEIYQRLNANYS